MSSFFREILEKYFPHMFEQGKWDEFFKAGIETISMMVVVGIVSFFLGTLIGVLLVATKKGGILENAVVYQVFDKFINIFRSIPFVILIAALIPVTRAIVGSAIGVTGSMVPLVFGTVPFFARQMESALSEVDNGLIEAAKSMGVSPLGIIWRVYLKESIPGIVRGTTITLINLLGLTAMAGVVGGGGLGDYAIRYGFHRAEQDVTIITVVVLLIMVSVIQVTGNAISRALKR